LQYSIPSFTMDEKTLSTPAAKLFYDRIGCRYDWFESYEARAKQRALSALQLSQGLSVLSMGVGTGKDQSKIISEITPGGIAYGMDISLVMLKLTLERTSAPVCQVDTRRMPFSSLSFDRLYASYVLDLHPIADLEDLIFDFHRVLKPSGILVITALNEGVDLLSRSLVAAWKGFFSLSSAMCGGCRPLELYNHVHRAGFNQIKREVVLQLGVPSEIITAIKT
jgi:ubiquinone/menaquinone biosynthesis C-methylase UbiE